jgi:hypothetical protein
MSTLWYVRRGVQVKGPCKAEVLAHFIAQGRVVDPDEVSRGRSQWQLLPLQFPKRTGLPCKPAR